MTTGSRRLYGGSRRFLTTLAIVLASATAANADTILGESEPGRPVPGAPQGTIDVAEDQGAGQGGALPTGDWPFPAGGGFPNVLQCGALSPLAIGALAAGMFLVRVPTGRRRGLAARCPTHDVARTFGQS